MLRRDLLSVTPAHPKPPTKVRWQRYSAIPADPSFTPLGPDAGINVGNGANHVAYLLCYLRPAAQNGRETPGVEWEHLGNDPGFHKPVLFSSGVFPSTIDDSLKPGHPPLIYWG